jgi:hypothetical protein
MFIESCELDDTLFPCAKNLQQQSKAASKLLVAPSVKGFQKLETLDRRGRRTLENPTIFPCSSIFSFVHWLHIGMI